MAFLSFRLTFCRLTQRTACCYIRNFSTLLSTQISTPLVLKASQFPHLFEEGPTETIYQGTLLEGLSPRAQGKLAEDWARRVLHEQNPGSEISDPEPGTYCNGNSRGIWDGRRVEVKSGRMVWNKRMRCWMLRFRNIKGHEFDALFLAAVSPDGLRLVQYDAHTGLHADGRRTECRGHLIEILGSTHDPSWQDAVATILCKLCEKGACRFLAYESFDKFHLSNAALHGRRLQHPSREAAYSGIPLRTLSSAKRGLRIEAMGVAVDRSLHPNSQFTSVLSDETAATGPRNTSNAFADWSRDGRRVELKSSSLIWQKYNAVWMCRFAHVKPELFDELWLSIYSPLGIHFYRTCCPQRLVFWTCGVASKHEGLHIGFRGPANEADPLKGLQVNEAKIISKGFELVAMVHWSSKSSEPDFSSCASRLDIRARTTLRM